LAITIEASIGGYRSACSDPESPIFRESLDPTLVKQAAQGAIERAIAEQYATAAYAFYVFQNGVSMPRLFRQAKQDEQYRFTQRQRLHMASDDMS
jgi:hypothetical protein